jgi:hypothetical protein
MLYRRTASNTVIKKTEDLKLKQCDVNKRYNDVDYVIESNPYFLHN